MQTPPPTKMKTEFVRSAALSREQETELLGQRLTPEQRSDYEALLHGQEVTRVSSERRMAEERPRLEEAAFQRKMQAKDELALQPIEESYESRVRRAREAAGLVVDAHEKRRRDARDELAADARWRFVKQAELEREGIDPKNL